MNARLEHYKGREQSFIKHIFLTRYLTNAAYKTFQGRSKVFNFIDSFAGPWRVNDDANYSDASFSQAVDTLENVRRSLEARGVSGLKIRFCFCEKRNSSVEELKKIAETKDSLEIHVFEGAFEDNLDAIAKVCSDGFSFTFIDPTGWNVRTDDILKFLQRVDGEFLLNFMSEHINRHAEYSEVAESFGRFCANPDWKNDYDKLPSDWSNERRMLKLLKTKIKVTKAARYTPDFPILKPRENRIKMRLILGTNSGKGLEVFRDTQHSVEQDEIKTRHRLKNSSGHEVSLFSESELTALEQNNSGTGCPQFARRAEELIVAALRKLGPSTYSTLLPIVLELVPIKKSQLNKLLVDMRNLDRIRYHLPDKKRVPQPSTIITLA
ncbi:three-Cys-motif partner protein TcmP [Hyphomonas sp.]|jgi:three-Cys-motif partner protein|uniref:Three-Cys-motif partner protein TcmP n=1 Tax=hydrothermal vent metagenome TaxID=652676 RepID=A0A160U0C2_9ZZZZ|nr:three-Cys-motif partner protein TcmP [Hyphomonas sp.]MDF1807010.1 three-Cys-motif partner protein TcmP [Hyphomonas sp.]